MGSEMCIRDSAVTVDGLKKKGDLLKNLRKAIEHGLSEEDALKSLTHTPAKMLGVSDKVGSLKTGHVANFIITSDNIFKEKTKIHHNWVRGKAFVMKPLDEPDFEGVYALKVGNESHKLVVDKGGKMKIEVNDSTNINVKHSYSNGNISLSVSYTHLTLPTKA